jgi:hypothetical protein
MTSVVMAAFQMNRPEAIVHQTTCVVVVQFVGCIFGLVDQVEANGEEGHRGLTCARLSWMPLVTQPFFLHGEMKQNSAKPLGFLYIGRFRRSASL